MSDGRIPSELHALFDHYREVDPNTATKRWAQVLALLADAPVDQLVQDVTHALARGTDDPAAIALLLRQYQTLNRSRTIEHHLLPESARVATAPPDLAAYATAYLAEGAA